MKDYVDFRGTRYDPEDDARGWTCIKVLPFLTGKKWDEVALAYVHSLRPSSLRIVVGAEACDAETWRVTVHLNDDKTIRDIEQEVEVWLPDGVAHGHALGHALRWGKESKQCKWHLDATGTMYDGVHGGYYKFTEDGRTVPFPYPKNARLNTGNSWFGAVKSSAARYWNQICLFAGKNQ